VRVALLRVLGLVAVVVTAAGAGAAGVAGVASAAGVTGAAGTAGAAAPSPAPALALARSVRLSDETTLSRYAYARTAALVHRTPAGTSPRAGRLRYQTEDRFPEPYLLLRSVVDARGREWVKLRLPQRPNGRTGWVTRAALGNFHVVRTHLRINRSTLRAVLYRDGKAVWRSRIGVGKAGTPTPAGRFYVRERFRVMGRGSLYGPYAFGTSAYSVLSDWPKGGIVGIHGTNQPGLIPGRPSHGCVRLPNRAILRLARLMPIGTPIHIL
jgi:L,D-transpeptidase catalytic domain